MTQDEKKIAEIAIDLQAKKNQDYGDSFDKTCDLFGLVVPCIRLHDKVMRLIMLNEHQAQVKEEKLGDTWMDMMNYAVMTIKYLMKTYARIDMPFGDVLLHHLHYEEERKELPPTACLMLIMSLHSNLKELELATPGQRIDQVINKACTTLYKLVDSAMMHCVYYLLQK